MSQWGAIAERVVDAAAAAKHQYVLTAANDDILTCCVASRDMRHVLCTNVDLHIDENWMHNWTGLDLVRREWRRTHHCANEIQPQSPQSEYTAAGTSPPVDAAYGILINIHISSFDSNTIPIFQRIDQIWIFG